MPQTSEEHCIKIELNGEEMDIGASLSVEELLVRLGLRREGIAVAIGGEVVPRSRRAERLLRVGDRVEIIQAVGGG